MNETLSVIAKRYSCRDFKSGMPADELLLAIAVFYARISRWRQHRWG